MRLSNKQKTLAIVAFRQLRIGEEDRHRIQAEFGGHRSLTKMSYQGWLELVRHLEECGFKGSGFRVQCSKLKPRTVNGESRFYRDSRAPLISKIYVLWYQLAGTYYIPGKEKAALRGFLRKRFRVDHENFLDTRTAIKVIEAIKAIVQRAERKAKEKAIWD